MNTLQAYGWNDYFAQQWQAMDLPQCQPARVTADFGSMLKIVTPAEKQAELSGRLLYFADNANLPKVGDWVAVQLDSGNGAVIEAVIPRQSEIARKSAGEKAEKQVMAANVDLAFLVQALDSDFSPERLQRYLYQLQASNIQAIVLLNKADAMPDTAPYIANIRELGVPCIVCSALTGQGIADIKAAIKPGQTATLLGSSGVGKSTLTNKLLGRDAQKTQAVREVDAKGRHTTTHRELFMLHGGGLLVDTPGIRELQLWGTEEELDENFDDIAALASQCRFSNCSHGTEPGCALQQALQSGELARSHYQNYLKMKRELQYLQTKANPELLQQKKKNISKLLKQHYKVVKQSPKHRR